MESIVILIAVVILWLLYEQMEHAWIKHSTTTVECEGKKFTSGLKIVLITDLHNNWKNWKKVRKRMNAFSPDLILLSGDIVNKHSKNQKNALRFFYEICNIAPIYYSMGNHEEYLRERKKAIWDVYREHLPKEINILDNASVEFMVRSECIRISGVSLPLNFYKKGALWMHPEDLPALPDHPERFHLLLAHHPEYMELYKTYHPDMVFSGHLHGGLIRLPFLGGLLAPRLCRSKEDSGCYDHGFGKLFVSRGVGSHTIPLRFFNRAEINYIILQNKK